MGRGMDTVHAGCMHALGRGGTNSTAAIEWTADLHHAMCSRVALEEQKYCVYIPFCGGCRVLRRIGALDQLADRSLCMREVPGSKPGCSIFGSVRNVMKIKKYL